ncbi:MAG: hypothetical protein GF384_08115 [Elusimicrobia bacterium]|nr:hypothetical protein [Elusimicrobiota bacterium]MBD3412597.1 hypothetical protein [Elusimicrobiota bacterium]
MIKECSVNRPLIIKKNHLRSSSLSSTLKARLKRIGTCADRVGIRMYLVGGCVRDLLLTDPVLDIDVMGEVDPGTVVSQMQGNITHHPPYGTYTINFTDGSHIDFATARKEVYPKPAALPVVSPGSVMDDIRRRDFTVNSLLISINKKTYGYMYDYAGGYHDLKKKILRVFHRQSFMNDPTRIFRAARFMGRYGMRCEHDTAAYLAQALRSRVISRLSMKRLSNEFFRTLREQNPQKAFDIMVEWDIMRYVDDHLAKVTWKPIDLPVSAIPDRCAWLMRHCAPDQAARILEKLMIKKTIIDTVVSILSAVRMLQKKQSVSDSLLEDFQNASIYNIRLLERMPGVNKNVVRKLRHYHSARKAFLNGADLHALGYVPGRSYGEIFRTLRRKIWEGGITRRVEAIDFIRKKFPLERYS